jgi:outer membrane lipoprotein carrier protein
MRHFFWLMAWLTVCGAAQADALDSLGLFLKTTLSGRADFVQTVTLPAKAGQAPRTKQSTGSFAFMRPQHFRLDYQKPFAQSIVADGKTLWLYDAELKQASARAQAQALGSTPMAVIALASDVAALQKEFQLVAQADQDGLQWVLATPVSKDAAMQSMRLGLRAQAAGVQLARLEMADAMGQRSVLVFDHIETNPSGLGPSGFQFSPPAGVEVLRP